MSVRTLPDDLKELARVECNEDSGQIPYYIQEIRGWLEKQPYLIVNTQENQWILMFLRCCKYDLEETKNRIDLYFSTKSITPEFFDNKDPLASEMQRILIQGSCIPIKSRNGPTKILIIWRKVDFNTVTFINFFKYGLMLYDILLDEDDGFVLGGQEVLHDMRDFPVRLVKQITPVLCKKSMFCILNAYPSRIKKIAFFNCSPTYEIFTKLFEPFIRQDIREKVTIHEGGLADVYNDLPLTDFPAEYGGEGGKIEEISAEWKTRFEGYKAQFLEDAQYRSDETKRIGRPKTSVDIYNIEDLFAKLDID